MKRLHVHVAVADLDQSIGFYATLFAAPPTVRKPDYAKWKLEDPRVNFAISARGGAPGIDHLGIQVEDEAELAEIRARLARAPAAVFDQDRTTCCYAEGSKSWIKDPTEIPWEAFLTMGEAELFGDEGAVAALDRKIGAEAEAKACCAAAEAEAKACCAAAEG